MRYFVLYIGLVFICFNCSVDELPACEGVGMEGEVCKEYQYVYGDYNGLNDYLYSADGEQLLVKTTQSKSGTEEGSTYYSYDDQDRVIQIDLRDSGGELFQTQTFNYNSNDELTSEEVDGDDSYSISYWYLNGVLKARTYKKSAVYQIDSLEYYSGTSDLYRTLKYKNGSVFEIEYNEWYGEFVNQKSRYDQFGQKLGSVIERFNALKERVEVIEYTANDNLKTKAVYTNFEGKLIEVVKYNSEDVVFEKLVYQRF